MHKYGFIGLGDQGAPIAQRMIDAGLAVVLWARRPETLERFSATTAERVLDIKEFSHSINYVGICVVDDKDVTEICNQLFRYLKTNSIIVIHSTISPELCIKLARQAEELGLKLIDAPVSGGSPAAKAGTLSVMVGGDTAGLELVRPVFETFACLIVHLGAVGAGQHAKLINNSMLAANMAIADSALAAAKTLGLDRQSFVNLINASSGSSSGFEVFSRMPSLKHFHHGAKLLAKDVSLLEGALNGSPAVRLIADVARDFLSRILNAQAELDRKLKS